MSWLDTAEVVEVDDNTDMRRIVPFVDQEMSGWQGYRPDIFIYCRDKKLGTGPIEPADFVHLVELGRHYKTILDSLPPVAAPSKTYYDHLNDGVERMARHIDEFVRRKVDAFIQNPRGPEKRP